MKKNKVQLICSLILTFLMVFGITGNLMKTEVYAVNTKPRIIVTSYSVSGDGVTPGSEFELSYTIKNTSTTYSVYSVLLTCTSDSGSVYPVYTTSDQVYIEELEPEQEQTVVMKFNSTDGIEVETLDFVVNMSYFDDVNGTSSNQSIIQIPVRQDSVLVIQSYSVPTTAVTQTMARVNSIFENTGLEELYNVTMTISGSGMEEVTSDIGTVVGNTKKQQEAYIEFTEVGNQSVVITYTYEDSTGVKYEVSTDESKVDVTSQTSSNVNNNYDTTDGYGTSIQPWQMVVIFAIILVAGFIVFIVRKQKK